MYNVLIVDDEPLICEGLTALLSSSGIAIEHIFNAHSGYEALDYIRMENIDLLVTDIQMGSMSGIELMQQAKIIKPWIEVIVISAHETFQYAQLAMRLGAKDYLIKPLNNEQFLSAVRHVLLRMDTTVRNQDQLLSSLSEHFHMGELLPERFACMNRLARAAKEQQEELLQELRQLHKRVIVGPYYAALQIKLDFSLGERDMSKQDQLLMQYAVLNISNELLDKEWNYEAFYSNNQTISILIQWDEVHYGDTSIDKVNQLEMIGRSLHFNIDKFLGLTCVIGISQLLRGNEFLKAVFEQAEHALQWNEVFKDHYVFYYGDFKWGVYANKKSEDEDIQAQSNWIVERSCEYIHQNYAQKGLTLNEIAQKNHVSPNYLSYLFKKIKGCNLWEYVVKLRMEESKRLIVTTDLRRYEISEQVGYESPEHFSKIFKKYYGMSPSEMKK